MKLSKYSPFGPIILATLATVLWSDLELAARAGEKTSGSDQKECETALASEDAEAAAEKKAAVKKLYELLTDTFQLPTQKNVLARVMGLTPKRFSELFGNQDDAVKILRDQLPDLERVGKVFVAEYMKCAKSLGVTPTFEEFADALGVDPAGLRTVIRKGGIFESILDVKHLAQDQRKSFRGILDRDIFNEQREKSLMEAIQTKQRLIVTTAVAGARVHSGFLSALLSYAKKNDATVIVIPLNMETVGLDQVLLDTPNVHILTNRIWLTPFLNLNPIKLTAKQIDPLTSLERMQGSQIVGSPQFRVKIIPSTNNDEDPRRLVTTGAVTVANFDGRYISERTNDLAEEVQNISGMGAYIMERTNGQSFAMTQAIGQAAHGDFNGRHVEYMPEKNGFMDKNVFYQGSSDPAKLLAGTSNYKVRHEAFVLGDLHTGHTRQALLEKLGPLVREWRPKRIVTHDQFNGHSVSHHDEKSIISMIKKLDSGELDLTAELVDNITLINTLLTLDPDVEIVIASANHNDWLKRWLERGGPKESLLNHKIGLYLSYLLANGVDPLQHVMLRGWGEPFQTNQDTFEITGKAFPKISDPNRVRFLAAGDSLRVGKEGIGKDGRLVQLAHHGHAGANGSRGSLKQFFNTGERIVYGHTHTDARMNWAVNVGTFTELRQSYNKEGLSSWMNSMALVGENGEIQVLTFVDEQWFAEPKEGTNTSQEFFYPKYPELAPIKTHKGWGETIDQYNLGFGKKKKP